MRDSTEPCKDSTRNEQAPIRTRSITVLLGYINASTKGRSRWHSSYGTSISTYRGINSTGFQCSYVELTKFHCRPGHTLRSSSSWSRPVIRSGTSYVPDSEGAWFLAFARNALGFSKATLSRSMGSSKGKFLPGCQNQTRGGSLRRTGVQGTPRRCNRCLR